MNSKKKIIDKYFDELPPEELEYIKRQIQFEKMKDKVDNKILREHLKDVKKYKTFRNDNGIKRCQKCNVRLINDTHHFLCNKCWDEKHPGKFIDMLNKNRKS